MKKHVYEGIRRWLSLGLCLCLAAGYVPLPALAEGCGHVHGEGCYTVTTDCVHTHEADCWSDMDLQAAGEEADACGHICSEDTGCVTAVLSCGHVHDGDCGYTVAQAVEEPQPEKQKPGEQEPEGQKSEEQQPQKQEPKEQPKEQPENQNPQQPQVKTVTAWTWVDELEALDLETGELYLAAAQEAPVFYEQIVEVLPQAIEATVDGETETLPIAHWESADYPQETGAYSGSYRFAASLPEGYTLAEDTAALDVTVEFGEAVTLTANAVGLIVDGVEEKYATFDEAAEEALAATGESVTVKLYENAERSKGLTVTRDLTIDLNGNKLEEKYSWPVWVKAGATLTLADSKGGGTSSINARLDKPNTGNFVVKNGKWGTFLAYSGGLTMENGKIEKAGVAWESKIQGGYVGILTIRAENVLTLSGGRFDLIRCENGASIPTADLLAPGYAFWQNRGQKLLRYSELPTLNGETSLINVTVVQCQTHVFENGNPNCIYCNTPCTHRYDASTGLCTICGTAHDHSFSGGICQGCGYACPHTTIDESAGACAQCGKTYEAAVIGSKDGAITYYADVQTALNNADGGTVKLLRDVAVIEINAQLTFDLNGYNVNGSGFIYSPCKLKNSGAASGFESDLHIELHISVKTRLGDLLEEGYGLRSYTGAWGDPLEEIVGPMVMDTTTVEKLPIQNLTLTANKTTASYGESQTVILTAAYTLVPADVQASVSWCEIKNGQAVSLEGTGNILTLPENVDVGAHTYRVNVTAGGYTKTADTAVTVIKAGTLENKNYPVQFAYSGNPIPNPNKEQFNTNNPNGAFSFYWMQGGIKMENGFQPQNAGTYQLHVAVGASKDYGEAVTELTVTITKKAVTITGTQVQASRTYDGTNTAVITSPGTVRGNADGENLTILPGRAAFADKNVGTGKTVTFSGFTLGGSAKDNYNLTAQPDNTTADITPLEITARVTPQDKDYDGTDTAAAQVRLQGVLPGDSLTLKSGTVRFAGKEAGKHKLIFTGFTLDGTDKGNYSLTIPETEAKILPTGDYLDLTGTGLENSGSITLEGKAYPIVKENGRYYVDLTGITGTYVTAYSYVNAESQDIHTRYPNSMTVHRLDRSNADGKGAKLIRIQELDNLLLYEGCSIRLTGNKGIRMITSIDEQTKKSLISGSLGGFTLEEYGTVVMRGVGEPTLADRSNYAYSRPNRADPIFARAGERIQYTNVLVNFQPADYNTELTLRPYIILKDGEGNTVTLYGGCVTRTIHYIAQQNMDTGTYKQGSAGYQYLENILNGK